MRNYESQDMINFYKFLECSKPMLFKIAFEEFTKLNLITYLIAHKVYYDFIDDKVNDFLAWAKMRVDLNE